MTRTYKLPIDNDVVRYIMKDAILASNTVTVDQLDCSSSWRRQISNTSPDEVLNLGLSMKSTIWTFQHKDFPLPYFDIGCRVMGKRIDYFLWIVVSIEEGTKLVEKYKLKEIK